MKIINLKEIINVFTAVKGTYFIVLSDMQNDLT